MSDKRVGKRPKFARTAVARQSGVLTLQNAYERFYDAMVALNRAKNTLDHYSSHHRYFVEYLGRSDVPVEDVTPEVIRSFVTYLLTEKRKWEGHKWKREENMKVGLSPVSVNMILKSLRTMFNWFEGEGIISNNPFDKVKAVREPETEIHIIPQADLKKLLKAPNQRTYAGFRDYVIMHLLLDAFLRINEALELKKQQIDFSSDVIILSSHNTKSRKSRIVPISSKTSKLLKELLEETEEFDSEYVFLTNYGERLSDDQFRNRLKLHAANADIKIRIYPHLFRHTAATMFLENGGDIRHLQNILGHADLRMVERYTHLSSKSLKNQHTLYSPINNVLGKLEMKRKRLR